MSDAEPRIEPSATTPPQTAESAPSADPVAAGSEEPTPPVVSGETPLTLADHVADIAEQFATLVDVLVELKEEVRGLRCATELLTVSADSRNGFLHSDRIEYEIGGNKNYGTIERMRPQDANTAMLGIEWENGQVGEVGSRNAGMTRLPRPISEPRPQFTPMENETPSDEPDGEDSPEETP